MRQSLRHHRLAFRWFILTALLTAAAGRLAAGFGGHQTYLPLVQRVLDCRIPGASYASLAMIPPPTSLPAADHPDMNLAIRGYEPTQAALTLVSYGPATDPNAPQLNTLFADSRLPQFRAAYQRYRWDWSCNCRTDTVSPWDTTVLGMGTAPGEPVHAPDSGYDIGGGYDAVVLYASSERLTLHYARQDDLSGYTIHVEDVCVEPGLLALYEQLNAAGRSELPALRGAQPIGRAAGAEIKVAVRDTGHFLDPRSENDWWQQINPFVSIQPPVDP